MIKIVPDKEGKLTQWDLNRKVIVTGYEGVAEVHFASPGDDHGAYVVELIDGQAEIPNILLTMAGTINVYVYPADRTVFATALWVMAREKPDDYVYTETEVLNWRRLDEKIGDLAELTTTARENLVAAINNLSEEIAEAKNVAQDYYLLKSPSGTVYKVTVTDSGTLQVVGEASGDEPPDDILTGRLLVWNDEFNEPEINASNWFFRRDSSEFVDTVVVADGVLDMPISYNANTGQWQRFQMLSSGLMDLKYGRIEARMKWDVGVHSAFWLVGQTSQRYNGVAEGVLWPRAGEIDVFEDNGDGAIYTTLHFGEKEGEDVAHDSISVCRKSDIDVTQWHTYGVEWTENMMIFYCDNVEMGRVDTSSIVYEDGTKPFQMPFYLIVSNRYGSGVTVGQTYHCYTDWVRYYAPEYVTTEIPIESISLSESTVELNPKRVRELELSITPEYVTDYTMRWYSSDKNVAKFSAGNRIETLTNGNTELSVVTKDGLTAKCNLIVSDSILNEVAVITLDAGESNTYYVGEVTTIEATVTPKWATYLDCDWETSDANIATVVDGVVTFVGGGEVTITAKAKDNSGVSCSITFTVIEKIVDNISLDGMVTKYTRKGWDSNGWAADDNSSDLLQISGYVQGVGYYYTNIMSNEQSYTPVNLDTSGDFSIAERVLLKKGKKSAAGAIWQIFASESVPSGTSISSSCVHFALENSGKGTARYYNPDGSIAINKYGAFDIYANKIADGYLTEDVVLNLVFTHNSSGGYAVYANGDLLVSGTDTGQAIKLDNPILCLGAYPGKTRQGGSAADFIYQALIAYNKCLTADDVSAVNTALNEMYS